MSTRDERRREVMRMMRAIAHYAMDEGLTTRGDVIEDVAAWEIGTELPPANISPHPPQEPNRFERVTWDPQRAAAQTDPRGEGDS